MYLYLIRHGIAADLDPLISNSNELLGATAIASDELRPLTKVGRKKIEQVADRIRRLELKFDLIVTSPLVRAQQTANILFDKQLSPKLDVSEDLKPMGNIQSWLTNWSERTDLGAISTVALIGHEPSLSEWAELFTFGTVFHQLILKKGGIIGLKFPDDRMAIGAAQLTCLIPPKYLI
jgi:phosphohistidine phosphatase